MKDTLKIGTKIYALVESPRGLSCWYVAIGTLESIHETKYGITYYLEEPGFGVDKDNVFLTEEEAQAVLIKRKD